MKSRRSTAARTTSTFDISTSPETFTIGIPDASRSDSTVASAPPACISPSMRVSVLWRRRGPSLLPLRRRSRECGQAFRCDLAPAKPRDACRHRATVDRADDVMCDTVQRQRRVAANMTLTWANDASPRSRRAVDSASPAAIDIVGGATLDAGGRVVDLVAVRPVLSFFHWLVSKSRHDLLVGSPLVAHRL